MASKNITRVDLVDAVYQRVGLSKAESAEMVDGVIREICDTLAAGEDVKLSGFGNFIVRSKGARLGRNPKTGEEAPIHPHQAVTFKPSLVLKARINGETSGSED